MTPIGASRRLLKRGIALALWLVLAAPQGALCLTADAPGGQMPCCPQHTSAPVVQPCCAIDADRSAQTTPAGAHAIAPQPLRALPLVPVPRVLRCAGPAAPANRPIEIRLLTSVFLI
jgi:hypothetical protein